jgi:ATP/ADP translocase/HEAT repeat protein
MQGLLGSVRQEERTETFWAAAILLVVMLGHAVLETSRDALFLANIPAQRLPWVYLCIAALALPSVRLFGRHHGAGSAHLGLIASQLAAAVGTATLMFLVRRPQAWVFYALYIWGGLASTLIVVRFWLLLGDRFTASQAKRLYPLIASGAVLGTVCGFGLTSLLGRKVPAHELLAVSTGAFFLSAAATLGLRRAALRGNGARQTEAPAGDEVGFVESVRIATENHYVRRLALVLLLSSVTATFGDFIFKTLVADHLPGWRMSAFLATTYFSINAVALVLLWLGVTPFIRVVGVAGGLALQPLLLVGGGLGIVISGGLAAAVALRACDGTLRWSLSKTATELLFVPLPGRVRNAVKALSDIVAHRGGQTLASLFILALLSTSNPPRWVGVAIVITAVGWIATALALRAPYLNLFRTALAEGTIQTRLDFPDLDVASLETLIAALSSPDDTRVMAALDLLHEKKRTHLVPALVLYHPSADIAVHALELFTEARRQDAVPLTTRLLSHPDPSVRVAALRLRTAIAPDAAVLEQARASGCEVVAASAIVALAAHGWMPPDEAMGELTRRLDAGGNGVALGVAQTLIHHPAPAFRVLLTRLAHDDDPQTRCAAVRAIGAAGDASLAPLLIDGLGDRIAREAAREALLALGEPALDHLQRALSDPNLPRATRAHVPRTISRFSGQRPADMLLAHLLIETEGMVRYKILRGLGRMVARDPDLSLDPKVIDQIAAAHLTGIFQLLHWRVALDGVVQERPQWQTTGAQLIAALLENKEALATERLFRVLGLRYRNEDLAQIYSGLRGDDPTTRSSSHELLEQMLSGAERTAVLGLVDDLPDSERLAAGAEFYQAEPLTAEALVDTLRQARSVSLSSLAAFYATQIGLPAAAEPSVESAPPFQTALDRLRVHSRDPSPTGTGDQALTLAWVPS